MICKNCGKEVSDNGYEFCPECGHKLQKADSEENISNVIEQLKNQIAKLQQDSKQLEKRKSSLILKKKTYKDMSDGIYPGLVKNPASLQSTFLEEKTEILEEKFSSRVISYIVLAMISIVSVFMPWFSIPLMTDYFGASSKNIFGTISTAYNLIDVGNSVNTYTGITTNELSSVAWTVIFVCIGILIVPCISIYLIWKCMQHKPEVELRKTAGFAGGYGILISIIAFIAAATINSSLNEGWDYNLEFARIEWGVWVSLIVSVLFILIPQIMPETVQPSEHVSEQAIEKIVEITNYDPALLFRPVRLKIYQDRNLELTLECCNYDYADIKDIHADLQLIKHAGVETIAYIHFFKARNSTILCAQFLDKKIDLSDVKEAKLYINKYSIRDEKEVEKSSGYYINSDYTAETLKNMRIKYGNPLIKKERRINNNYVCTCGHITEIFAGECQMCGRKFANK